MQKTEVRFGDTLLRLNSDGSAFIPEHNTLLIADVHLGKSGVFRKAGIPAPQGLHEKNIRQLTRVFEMHPGSTVVFLGDVFHGLQNNETQSLQFLLNAHPQHTFILVKGNHDFDLPEWKQLNVVDEWTIGKLLCLHEPPGSDFDTDTPFTRTAAQQRFPGLAKDVFLVCGHLHPGVALRGKGRSRARIKAFYSNQWLCVLPAFGTFTGQHPLKVPGTYYGIVDGTIVKLTS
jgi:metallophosphoesterase superfamily enzyme